MNKLIMTCSACPSQWEGELNEVPVYIRYRWGRLSVRTDYKDDSQNNVAILDIDVGGQYDGVMMGSELEDILKTFGIINEDILFTYE